jgi:hypothetical protein
VLAEYDVFMEHHTSPAMEPFLTNICENAVQRLTRILHPRLRHELPQPH